MAENNGVEATVKETLLDQVQFALKNPSMEHWQIYIGLGLCITAAVLMSAIQGQMIKNAHKKDEPSVEGAPHQVSQIDRDALYQELDRTGPFPQSDTGTIKPEHFVKLKRVIGKHAYLSFMEELIFLQKSRIPDLIAKNEESYKQKVIHAIQKQG